ncbi:hypothetical protein [Alkalihalobacillus sp. 1P02AB]
MATGTSLNDRGRRSELRKDHLGQIAVYAYEQALLEKPLSDVLKELKLTV